MKRRLDFIFTISLLILDILMGSLAFYLAYRLRLKIEYPPLINPPPFQTYWGMSIIQVTTLVVIFFFYKLYHLKRGISRLDEFYSIVTAVSVGTIMATAFTALIFKNELDYPRLMVVYAWLLSIVFITLGRLAHNAIQSALRARGIAEERVLIVGSGDAGRMILNKIRQSPDLGYRVGGFIDDAPAGEKVMGLPVLGKTDDIGAIIDAQGINEVIIGLPEAPHQKILEIISRCERGRVSIKVFPDVFQIMASAVSIDDLNGLPLLAVRDVALRGWKLTLKRAVDLIISTAALVFLSPLMLLIALLIKLDSPGPVFYTQERMGLDAKPFQILKFRSMRQDAEENGPGWTTADDPRRTRLGKILRRFSLDELPQFINVLLGEMSVVGPRPERPVFVEQFKQMVPRYMERHKEKAGITGWAQVNGLRGDTSIWERTKYDLWYIENWSLWLDFKIMIKTVFQILSGKNAY